MSQLELNLYENAIDSITHAIEHYVNDPVEERRYKYAILHLSQGVILLLKERLSREHPNFIFKDVSKPEGSTIDVKMTIARLQSIANIDLGDAENTILTLAKLRNEIEHFAVNISKQQADSIIGKTVPFLALFVSNDLGRQFELEIGDKVWQDLIRIQEYRDNAINTAKKMIASQKQQPYHCEECHQDTATKTYYQEDEWSLHSYSISCLACLALVSRGMVCLGCQKEIPTSERTTVNYYSYCADCKHQATQEFQGLEFPTYGYEIRRWFQKNNIITYSQLLRFVRNVSTLGSGAVRLPNQLFRIGAIDFADDFYKRRHQAMKSMLPEELRELGLATTGGERLNGDERFIWVWNKQEIE